MGIPAQLFQILKDDAVKVLHSIWQQIWKTQQWPQDWKRSVFIPIPKKGNDKEFSKNHRIALISHTSKVMLKILQASLQQYMNRELLDFKLVLEKVEEPEIILPTSVGSLKRQEFQENINFYIWLCQSLWLCRSKKKCGKFWKRWEYQTTWPASWGNL